MAKLKCTQCNNTYFCRIRVSEYHSTPTNLYRGLEPIDDGIIVVGYECIKCGKVALPPLSTIETNEADIKLYLAIEKCCKGE